MKKRGSTRRHGSSWLPRCGQEGEEYRTQALRERVEAESAAVAEGQPRLAREPSELAGWMEECYGK